MSPIERGAQNYFYLQRMKVRDVPTRLPYIRALCSGRDVLHVGCTDYPVFDPTLNLHIQIHDVCTRLDGLDTDAQGLAVLSRHVPGSYFSSTSEVTRPYHLLLVPETIEHVHNIQMFLEDLNRLAFAEVLITAPCLLGWQACFNYRDYPGWRHADLNGHNDYIEEVHPDHKAWFTPYTLSNCIEQFTSWNIFEILFLEEKRMVAVHAKKM